MCNKLQKDQIIKETEKKNELVKLTENILQKVTNKETEDHLNGLIQRTQQSIIKLEAKRKYWNDIEKKNMMEILSAMSLINNTQIDTVRSILPELTTFRSNKIFLTRNIPKNLNIKENFEILNESKSFQLDIPYSQKLLLIDKIQPPLTDYEKKLIINQKETFDITKKFLNFLNLEKMNFSELKIKS